MPKRVSPEGVELPNTHIPRIVMHTNTSGERRKETKLFKNKLPSDIISTFFEFPDHSEAL